MEIFSTVQFTGFALTLQVLFGGYGEKPAQACTHRLSCGNTKVGLSYDFRLLQPSRPFGSSKKGEISSEHSGLYMTDTSAKLLQLVLISFIDENVRWQKLVDSRYPNAKSIRSILSPSTQTAHRTIHATRI